MERLTATIAQLSGKLSNNEANKDVEYESLRISSDSNEKLLPDSDVDALRAELRRSRSRERLLTVTLSVLLAVVLSAWAAREFFLRKTSPQPEFQSAYAIRNHHFHHKKTNNFHQTTPPTKSNTLIRPSPTSSPPLPPPSPTKKLSSTTTSTPIAPNGKAHPTTKSTKPGTTSTSTLASSRSPNPMPSASPT